MYRRFFIMLALCVATLDVMAQSSDMGAWMDASMTKKIGKQWSVDAEVEYRMKDNLQHSDRIGLGLGTSFKVTKWLKAAAGYNFLYSYNASETSSGGKKQYDSYWYPRHRVYAGLTGTVRPGRWRLSLRERWVYTYRPEKTLTGTKLSSGSEVTKTRSEENENVLRSKFTAEYNINKCPITPFASVEAYNRWELQKIRYSLGASYDIGKHHNIKMYYLFQDRKSSSDDEEVIDNHIIGLSYNYSF